MGLWGGPEHPQEQKDVGVPVSKACLDEGYMRA